MLLTAMESEADRFPSCSIGKQGSTANCQRLHQYPGKGSLNALCVLTSSPGTCCWHQLEAGHWVNGMADYTGAGCSSGMILLCLAPQLVPVLLLFSWRGLKMKFPAELHTKLKQARIVV